jgi:Xaa-Pro aminopeptidase
MITPTNTAPIISVRRQPMSKKQTLSSLSLALLFVLVTHGLAFSQAPSYSTEEFVKRRNTLMDRVGDGLIILFGEPDARKQDNNFYYMSGVEDMNSILVMAPKTKEAYLFLPRQNPRENMVEGPNLLADPDAKTKTGMTDIYPLNYFDEFLARNTVKNGLTFYVRLSPRLWEDRIFIGRTQRIHYNDRLSLDNYRVKKLKERYPIVEIKDIEPHIAEMRVIKSTEEMEVLRKNGKISAEAVKQAILATEPGAYEYELHAAAMNVVLRNGATEEFSIVGSGPNTCVWHYAQKSRRVEAGDLILMDFGANLAYQTMDITRTWPATGRFTPEQREVYEIVLAVQKACIEAYRPGITTEDVHKHVAEVMKEKGLDPRGLTGGIGHYVGMDVHDVGPRGIPLKEGMVFAIEPALYYPEKNLGIRIEDTVLITKDGCEVLSKDVPKEIDEIEKLMSQRKPQS